MSVITKDLGAATAYAYAVEKGYTGTEAEFAELMADYAEVGQRAENAAGSALESKTAAQTAATTATNKASEAATSAQTATTKAGEAQTSAQTASSAATSASQSASQASGYAQTAETAKTDAQTAKTQAETARDNAVTAKTAAETAQGKAEDAQAAAERVAESIPSDYSQLSGDVSDLKEDFDTLNPYVKKVYGTNRFNPAVIYDGYLTNTGALHTNTSSTHYSTSDYCFVEDFTQIMASATQNDARVQLPIYFLCTYNANKEFIEMVASTATLPYILGSGVSYVRFSWRNNYGYTDIALEDKAVRSRVFRPFYEGYILTDYASYKWDAVGDSLTEYNQRTNTNYCQYIAERLGITVKNYGASGTGYKRTEDDNKAFYQRINSVDTTADIVTIFGSGNDMPLVATALGDIDDTGTDTICGCINTTIDNLYAIMPTVQLGIITPCPWKNYNPNDETNPMALYSAKLVEICKARGIPCLDLYHCSNLRPWDTTFRTLAYKNDDGGGTHPDELGQKIIATQIEAFIKTLML